MVFCSLYYSRLKSLKFHWYDGIFILLFYYLFVLQIQAIWSFTIDDMFIPLRYARHWLAGDGLLWNPQSPPVEGYSNFSFVVLSVLSLLFKVDPVLTLKVAGLVGLFLTCFFIFFISRFWFETRLSLVPCIGLLLYKGQILWAVAGLETSVYEALICASVYFSFRGIGYNFFPKSRQNAKPIFFLMAGLTLSFAGMARPEAPVLMLVFLILLYRDQPSSAKKTYNQGLLLFVLSLLLLFLPYFLWRWHYYGFLLPNSVACKGFVTSNFSLDQTYLALIWPLAGFAFFACLKTKDKRYPFLYLPSLLYLLMLVGAERIVAFDNRLFLPAFVLLLPLALKGMSDLLLQYLHDRDKIFILSLSILSVYLAFFFIPFMSLSEYRYFTKYPIKGEQLRNQVVQWLKAHAHEDDFVVLADAGYIPYYSKLNYIDSYCLNNLTMTQYPKAQRYEQFCHQIIKEKPQILILTSLVTPDEVLYTPADKCLKSFLKQQNSYHLAKIFSVSDQKTSYRYELFSRRI